MRRLLADPDGRADLLLAVGVWIVSGLAYYGAAILPPPRFDPVGSAAIPKIVATVLAVLAGVIVARRVWLLRDRSASQDEAAEAVPFRPDIAIVSIAIMLGYVAVMAFGLLGFREATIPFVILLGGVMSRFRRRTMLILTPLAFALAIGFGWLFAGALYIDLPVTRWLQ